MLGVSTFHPPPLKPPLHYSITRLKPYLPFSLSLPKWNKSLSSSPRPLSVRAIDAAQLFDYESKLALDFHNAQKLKIAIVGFGNFGQFLAKTLVRQGHTVLAHSRSDYSDTARKIGVTFFPNADDLCEEHPEVILLCSSIISTEQVLLSLPLQRLKRSTLFVDVLSVKEFPKNLLLEVLPNDFDIVCSHPMFGPESASRGWSGLPFVYEKVRVGTEEHRVVRCEKFLDVFGREGCRMVEMNCADHDRLAAGSQFITHTVGRVLDMLMLESTPINTKGYESLLNLVENTAGDSFDLYYGLFMFNKNSLEMLERLDFAFEDLRKQLIGRLHDVVRKQLFENAGKVQNLQDNNNNYSVQKYAQNGSALVLSSKDKRSNGVAELHKYKSNNSSQSDDKSKLKIAIIGFGNFGQFLAKTMLCHGHEVLAYSRSDYSDVAQEMGVSYFNDADDLCEQHPEVILLCTSILSTEKVLKSFPVQRLKRKLEGMNQEDHGCDQFLNIFSKEGCQMVEMSCAEHDWHAAGSQFITHTTGRFLEKLKLEATPVDTKGYETLLSLVENTAGDSFDLYYGLFLYNINAMEQLERFDLAIESLKKQLFDRLHGIYRKQVFKIEEKVCDLPERSMLPEVSEDSNVVSSLTNTVDTKGN
ncbi:Pyrroline-5-carboxylate reductase, catalytic, N-terminal [Sesbania bispinosa]|nr:Pyrroline-5-carboxylate reductase, catalytic, N-terminal [Sesbania bispinosa]